MTVIDSTDCAVTSSRDHQSYARLTMAPIRRNAVTQTSLRQASEFHQPAKKPRFKNADDGRVDAEDLEDDAGESYQTSDDDDDDDYVLRDISLRQKYLNPDSNGNLKLYIFKNDLAKKDFKLTEQFCAWRRVDRHLIARYKVAQLNLDENLLLMKMTNTISAFMIERCEDFVKVHSKIVGAGENELIRVRSIADIEKYVADGQFEVDITPAGANYAIVDEIDSNYGK